MKGIIFDLDGTLVNSLYDLADSMNQVLEKHNFPTHSLAEYEVFVGKGIFNLVLTSLPKNIKDETIIESCYKEMVDIYSKNCTVKTAPYAGIIELLDELKSRGIKLAVFSNKADKLTKKVVETLMPNYFDAVVGLTDEALKKPNPTAALQIREKLGIIPENMLYVGDSGIDMQTANNANMFAIGVLWGYRTEEELIENGAKKILKHPMELIEIL